MEGLDCSKITVGFEMENCDDLAIAGTQARFLIMSFSDIDRSLTKITDNVCTALVLKTGAKAYAVDSLPNATVGEDTINVGTYRRTHQHNLTGRIFKKSEAAKKFINGTTNARVVALVENIDHGDAGDTKYEIYGLRAGLELNDLTASTEMADGVAYLFTLGSGTISQEPSLPVSFFDTDETTTDEAVEALLTASAGGGSGTP